MAGQALDCKPAGHASSATRWPMFNLYVWTPLHRGARVMRQAEDRPNCSWPVLTPLRADAWQWAKNALLDSRKASSLWLRSSGGQAAGRRYLSRSRPAAPHLHPQLLCRHKIIGAVAVYSQHPHLTTSLSTPQPRPPCAEECIKIGVPACDLLPPSYPVHPSHCQRRLVNSFLPPPPTTDRAHRPRHAAPARSRSPFHGLPYPLPHSLSINHGPSCTRRR